MTTAQEMEIMLAASDKVMARIARRLEVEMKDVFVYGMHIAVGNQVCARRARKLRMRGEDVRRIGSTKNGKTLYSWLKRISPLSIVRSTA